MLHTTINMAEWLCLFTTHGFQSIHNWLTILLYTTCNITVSDLIDTSGRDLFRKVCSSEHSLRHLLPPERKYSNLRNRGRPYELPEYCTNLHKKSFDYSIIVFVHLIFLNICELSFNRDFAHCWRAFDMSNKYYLLTYLLTRVKKFSLFCCTKNVFPCTLCSFDCSEWLEWPCWNGLHSIIFFIARQSARAALLSAILF